MRYCSHRRGWVGFSSTSTPRGGLSFGRSCCILCDKAAWKRSGEPCARLETCYAHSRMLLFHRALFGFHRGELVIAPFVYQRGCSWVSSLSAPRTATLVASGDNPHCPLAGLLEWSCFFHSCFLALYSPSRARRTRIVCDSLCSYATGAGFSLAPPLACTKRYRTHVHTYAFHSIA